MTSVLRVDGYSCRICVQIFYHYRILIFYGEYIVPQKQSKFEPRKNSGLNQMVLLNHKHQNAALDPSSLYFTYAFARNVFRCYVICVFMYFCKCLYAV